MQNSKCKIQSKGISPSFNFKFLSLISSKGGFTLLEVLVALAILGIAITVILQLFSANLRTIAASEDYISAAAKAEAKMRDIISDPALSEKSWSERTDDGYNVEVSIFETHKERTETLPVKLLEVDLSLNWTQGQKNRSIVLKTIKTVDRGLPTVTQ